MWAALRFQTAWGSFLWQNCWRKTGNEVKTKWSSRKASYCTLKKRRAAPHISSGYVACMESRTSRPGHDPEQRREDRGSRMLCADKLWRLGGHDPYSLIMIRRFGRDPGGSHSVAGCGKCQWLGSKSRGAALPAATRCFSFNFTKTTVSKIWSMPWHHCIS